MTRDGIFSPLTEAYRKSCDFAFEKVSTGAQDYITAIREATRNLADKGIQVINYESGVRTSMEAAVRRNIMGGLGLMQEKISQQNHDDLGCDGWEISAHFASAPDHEPIQGRQYSDAEYKKLNDSLVRRIGELGCGHAGFPIILGVNSPQYTQEELEQIRRDNEKGIDYEGRHYTMYKATQRQRQMERDIRKQERNILVDEKTGDKKKLQTDQIRYQLQKQEYKRFSDAAGLRLQHERMEISGFGPKQARAAEKAAKEEMENQFNNLLEKAKKGDKIVLDSQMEDVVAQKPYSKILPLREKLSDRAVRKWYLAQDSKIPSLIDRTVGIEDQARQAFNLRNQNRTDARNLMRDQKKRRELDATDPNWSFEDLISSKMKRKGLSREEALEDIIASATKTRKSVNKKLGLE